MTSPRKPEADRVSLEKRRSISPTRAPPGRYFVCACTSHSWSWTHQTVHVAAAACSSHRMAGGRAPVYLRQSRRLAQPRMRAGPPPASAPGTTFTYTSCFRCTCAHHLTFGCHRIIPCHEYPAHQHFCTDDTPPLGRRRKARIFGRFCGSSRIPGILHCRLVA